MKSVIQFLALFVLTSAYADSTPPPDGGAVSTYDRRIEPYVRFLERQKEELQIRSSADRSSLQVRLFDQKGLHDAIREFTCTKRLACSVPPIYAEVTIKVRRIAKLPAPYCNLRSLRNRKPR